MRAKNNVPFFRRINFVIGLCFLLLALVYVITSVYSIMESKKMQDTNEEILQNSISYADRQSTIEVMTTDMQRLMITAILAANAEARDSSLQEYNTITTELGSKLDELESVMQQDGVSGYEEILSGLRSNLEAYVKVCDDVIAASDINRQVAFDMSVNKLAEPKAALDKSYAELTQLITDIQGQGIARSAAMMKSSRNVSIIGMAAFLAVVVVTIAVTILLVTAPLRRVTVELNTMIEEIHQKKGDLSRRINVKSRNEIGSVVAGINEYVETLQTIMQKLKMNADSLSETSNAITASMREANESVDRSNSAMEQVSRSMQNVTDTTEDISSRLREVHASVEDMNESTRKGGEFADGVMKEAKMIQKGATEKKLHTGSRIEELKEVLTRSVENSAQVKRIGDLTNNILDIASQTNLLSLNASIEAARAGEAGRGFAVVAGEISHLAEDSSRTAVDIQNISKSVTEAVQELSDNATAMIDFINEVVLADYDAFVDTGNRYEESAGHFNELLQSLLQHTRQLDGAMDAMNGAVKAISVSVEDSAAAITTAENNAGEISDSISDVNSLVQTNQEISGALNHEVGRFAKL